MGDWWFAPAMHAHGHRGGAGQTGGVLQRVGEGIRPAHRRSAELLPDLFAPATRNAAVVLQLSDLILKEDMIDVGEVAKRLSIDIWTLRLLSTRYFGLPVKPLLLRARFIRSFVRWLSGGELASYAGIADSYHGASHFLRDASRYLGSTPRRFAAQETAFLRASLRARYAVLGAAAHVLHQTR